MGRFQQEVPAGLHRSFLFPVVKLQQHEVGRALHQLLARNRLIASCSAGSGTGGYQRVCWQTINLMEDS